METRRELRLLNRRPSALNLQAGLVRLLGLPSTVVGMVKGFRQVTKVSQVPVLVRADEQSAFRYFLRVMDAIKGTGAVQLAIETEPGP